MQSDFTIITHKFPQNRDLTIIPIADVHLGAAEHLAAEWLKLVEYVHGTPDVYVTLGGDLINNATRSSVSNIFDETMRPREQKKRMAELLAPIRNRILCAVSGNHERRSGKDADDDGVYDIMCKLDLEDLYRENMAFVKLQIGNPNNNGQTNPTYILAVTHGAGGGALSGGIINRNERFGYALDGVDALIVGHSHKPMMSQPAKLHVDPHNNRVSIRPFKVVVGSAFLGYGGYAAQKMLLPTSHSIQILKLYGKRKHMEVSM